MTKTLTISNQLTRQTSLRLDLLYAEALDQVRKMGKETWTNHNTHDPGLTILEQLCFALTDLGYRLSFDMADLLAEPPDGSATVAAITSSELEFGSGQIPMKVAVFAEKRTSSS